MGAWFDYSLDDFLLFAPETYWRLFEQLNAAVWPLQVVILVATALAIAALASAWRKATLAVGLCLAISWALVAHLFFASYYEPINWAIAWVTPLAWIQAGLLAALAPRLRFSKTKRTPWLAYGLLTLALAYPLIGVAAGRPMLQSEIAGLAPDPTALLTIGVVGIARADWRSVALQVLPIGWLVVSMVTMFAMEAANAWVLLTALCAAMLSLCQRK